MMKLLTLLTSLCALLTESSESTVRDKRSATTCDATTAASFSSPRLQVLFVPEMTDFIHLDVVGVPDREQQGEGLLGRDVREEEAGDELGQSSRCTEK